MYMLCMQINTAIRFVLFLWNRMRPLGYCSTTSIPLGYAGGGGLNKYSKACARTSLMAVVVASGNLQVAACYEEEHRLKLPEVPPN